MKLYVPCLSILFKQNSYRTNTPIQLAEKANIASFAMHSAFTANESNSPELLLKLFHTLVPPIITYGSQIAGQDFVNFFDYYT